MRTKIFLFAIVLSISCLLVNNVYCQEFKAGLLFGGVVSQVDGDAMGGFNKLGAMGGMFANRKISPKGVIQGELCYVMKGSRVQSSKNTNFNKREVTANYVDLSLYYKYFFDENANIKLGIVPSVLIYHDEKTAGGLDQDDSNLPGFRKINMLLSIGAEYFLNQHLFATLSFNYSLFSFRSGNATFYDKDYYHFIFEDGQYHNYFTLGLGYQF